MVNNIERCLVCGEPTERSGKGEDSIYLGDIGPFCSGCYNEIRGAILDEDTPVAESHDRERELMLAVCEAAKAINLAINKGLSGKGKLYCELEKALAALEAAQC